MFLLVIRKMIRNKWLVLCLLIGSIFAIAMVSTVPTYSDAVFMKMLTKDLEGYQEKSGQYPGKLQYRIDLASAFKEDDRVPAYNKIFSKEIPKKVAEYKVSFVTVMQRLDTRGGNFIPTINPDKYTKRRYIKIETINDIEEHIEFVKGGMCSGEVRDGIIEVIISSKAMEKTDLLLDEIYKVDDSRLESMYQSGGMEAPRFKVVGIYNMKDEKDPFWIKGIESFNGSFIIDYNLFNEIYLRSSLKLLTSAEWFYAIDYHKIRLNDIPRIVSAYNNQKEWIHDKYRMSTTLNIPVVEGILTSYSERVKSLNITLLILIVPVLIMLAFYIFMVSQLLVENEKNEIAVLKSRGASRLQIFELYLIESAILGGTGLILGPPLGLFMCKVLGASNGFLEFVQRTALPVMLSFNVYMYALAALLLFMVTMLIPAYLSSKTTIVEYKRARARKAGKSSAWKKYFLDFVLLALSGYGLYKYKVQKAILGMPGIKATDLGVDPMLFLICTFFIIGAGLLFLRIYPYLINFVFWLGRKVWSPVFYVSFVQVGRSGGKEQFIMLFLILTLSIGIFNANTARTVNRNLEDKIRYVNGTDIAASSLWMARTESGATVDDSSGNPLAGNARYVSNRANTVLSYYEPPYSVYNEIKGINSVTKVLRNNKIEGRLGSGPWKQNIYLMGITAEEFGDMLYTRDDLGGSIWYEYLEKMTETPNGVLISQTFLQDQKLEEGDLVYYKFPGQRDAIEGVIVGIVDYWPTFNPNDVKQETRTVGGKNTIITTPPYLIVANMESIAEKLGVQPYEVWMKRDQITDTKTIYEDVLAKKVNAVMWEDTAPQFIANKNDPFLKGTNGILTLGFLVTLIISLIGFIIYWVLSIQSRMLQFGILRAIGLNMKKLIAMLISEQVLISAVALGVGIIIGGQTSDMFVPLLQVIYNTAQQILPFLVMTSPIDYIRVYSFAGFILVIGFVMLGAIVSKINVGQALKLGED